jgi:hypothetical protein
MVKKILLAIAIFIPMFWILSPKEAIYYMIEDKLKQSDIIISNEKFHDGLFGFSVEDGDLYIMGMKSAKIKSIDFNFLLLFNRIVIENVEFKGSGNFFPNSVSEANIAYSILNPMAVNVDVNGSFGVAQGRYEIKNSLLHIDFPVSKDVTPFRSYLQQNENGLYYETNF